MASITLLATFCQSVKDLLFSHISLMIQVFENEWLFPVSSIEKQGSQPEKIDSVVLFAAFVRPFQGFVCMTHPYVVRLSVAVHRQ